MRAEMGFQLAVEVIVAGVRPALFWHSRSTGHARGAP
jgi:hypothetical protein